MCYIGGHAHPHHPKPELNGIVRNTCRLPGAAPDTLPFDVTTTPNLKQVRALELISTITM